MKYELAKELKDAGFPQELGMGSDYYIGGSANNRHYRQYNEPAVNDVKVPTLSELIDACVALSESGDFHLEHWEGSYRASTCWRQPSPGLTEWLGGTTPEEAVARLWLALNRKA